MSMPSQPIYHCNLRATGQDRSGYSCVDLTYDGNAITEARRKKLGDKPKTSQIPRAIYGSNPLTFIGSRAMEWLAKDYDVQSESEALASDRVQITCTLATGRVQPVLTELLLPEDVSRLLKRSERIRTMGLLVAVANDELADRVHITAQRSALDVQTATLIGVLSQGSMRLMASDYSGAEVKVPDLTRGIASYESLGETRLDRLEAIGIPLRVIDYRKVASPMVGFVGF